MLLLALLLWGQPAAVCAAPKLPQQYFRLLEAGIAQVEQRLAAEPTADLQTLESPGNGHLLFPHAVLAAATLYAKADPENHSQGKPRMLSLAMKIGDLLAAESERGSFSDRPRDTYMWLEAFRVLEKNLGAERRNRWRRELEKNIAVLAAEIAYRMNVPSYQSPFLGTSPNHLALWASTVYLAGKVFRDRTWEESGARVMHRFAAEEQSTDGYWGEHERSLPTPGYNYNTYASVALYAEWSQDPAALKALRRGLDFHKFFTWPDGSPVEVLDDRNRFTIVPGWGRFGPSTWLDPKSPPGGNDESASKGHFGFSRFPDGRRYAEFLTSFFHAGQMAYEDLGRIAQNALYYHRGPRLPIPQDMPRYARRLTVPAGIRKTGSWVVALSGLRSRQPVRVLYNLDRQANLSVFHSRLGLIITGGNSKRQPELATFSEKLLGDVLYLPINSHLQMSETADRLSLAYNTFFSDLFVTAPNENRLQFRFAIVGKGAPPEEARLTLQLCLKAGETLETAAGRKIVLGTERITLSSSHLGGWLRHHGWRLTVDPTARLVWPVYPHNPYTGEPEKSIEHAVGALSVPLRLKDHPDRYLRVGEQEISFVLEVY